MWRKKRERENRIEILWTLTNSIRKKQEMEKKRERGKKKGKKRKTRQDGDLTWEASAHKVTWSYNHVILQDHVAN